MNERQKNVALWCDGERTSREIAALCGDKTKYVQEVMLKFDLPRRKRGSAYGPLNGSYKCGRSIDRDGYALVPAPAGHPYCRKVKNRHYGRILEHRLLMEQKIGRYLLPEETVDHIDGLRLHNSPDNLRLFSKNSDHLTCTIRGATPNWSKAGSEKQTMSYHDRTTLPRIDTYNQMKKAGDVRLREILLTLLKFDIDSPYLLGTHRHLKKAGISDFSHSNLRRELAALCRKYA